MNRRCIPTTLLLLCAAGLVHGQTAEARFHRGDDLRWADPSFDDSNWEPVASRRLPRLEEFKTNRLWVRTHVVIPAGEPVALVFRYCACEFYLNGKRVGSTGNLNSPRPNPGRLVQVIWLPADTPPGPALLAIRHYIMPGMEVVGSSWRRAVPRIVPGSEALAAYRQVRFFLFEQVAGVLLLILVAALAALAGLRFDLLSVLICQYLAVAALNTYLYSDWGGSNWFVSVQIAQFTIWPQTLIVTAVASMLAGVPLQARWFGPFACLIMFVRAAAQLELSNASPSPLILVVAVGYPLGSALAVTIDLVLVSAGWRRPAAPRPLLVVALLIHVFGLLGRFGVGFGAMPAGIPILGSTLLWDNISKLLFGVLAGAFVIRRARERRAEEQRMKGELQAARSVQSMLLGQSMPAGVDAVYVPASEVGGDFYYVAETPQGTLVMVGDVSGKGLQAAMTVSAILGTLRGLVVYEPDQVLATLNRTLVGNTAGFVTCCCVLVRNVEVLVANAGHPAPYFDGVECTGESGLPLVSCLG